jgi:hypothetical protein
MRRPLRNSTRPRWPEFGTARTSDAAWSGANQWQTRSSSGGPVTTPPNHPSGSGPQENQDEPPPGAWRPTPPAFLPYLSPHWGQVTPFAIPTGDFFRPNGPPALACAKYAADYNEVKGLGAAVGSSRTLERTEIALFWSGGAGTVTPPGDWNVSSPRMSLPFAGTPCAKRTPLRPDSSPLINPPPVRRKATFPLLWPLSRLRTVRPEYDRGPPAPAMNNFGDGIRKKTGSAMGRP